MLTLRRLLPRRAWSFDCPSILRPHASFPPKASLSPFSDHWQAADYLESIKRLIGAFAISFFPPSRSQLYEPTTSSVHRGRGPPSTMRLLHLPVELQLKILEDDGLTTDDHKALRLTARDFHPPVNAALFGRVAMSKTKKDWDVFRNIASRPDLAGCVREVVWYELIEDHRTLCHSQGMQEGCWCERKADEVFPVTTHELAPLAKDLFWLSPETVKARDGAELADLKEQFQALVVLLPKLESVVSTPMPPRYVLSNGPYVFTAQLFYRNLGLTGPGYSRHSISSGFFHFLTPAMTHSSSKIRRLHFVDHPTRSAIHNFTDPQSPVFENLTDINLCLSIVRNTVDLWSCLRRAGNLVRLRVRLDVPETRETLQAIASLFGTSSTRYWPRITTLELSRVTTRVALLSFLGAHSLSLRSLTLHECNVYRDVLKEIAGVPRLNLTSFRVIASEGDKTQWVNEQDLLAFVNGADKSGLCIENIKERRDISTFSTVSDSATHESRSALDCEVWNHAGHPAANDFDTFRSKKDSSCGQSIYAREKREIGAPMWKVTRDDGNEYFWSSDDADALETRAWRFTHRSGEVAIGDEPLDYFSDWDSDGESRDVCEAVPACRASHVLASTPGEMPGEMPVDGGIPEGAMQFEDGECGLDDDTGWLSESDYSSEEDDDLED